jgi:3-dehydroquinate synthase
LHFADVLDRFGVMKVIQQEVPVSFTYNVFFTQGIFEQENTGFTDLITNSTADRTPKVLFVFDEGMYDCHPDLFEKIQKYAAHHMPDIVMRESPVVLPGGERTKNDPGHVKKLYEAVNGANLDRHSYIVAIGGGAVIDAAGYAAATAHRGIRLIRIPTTVLSQNDASVGVKNGINEFGKKNFLGSFTPPFAVINDTNFLHTLS